jgi:flavin-dependent dehydrogenase
MVDALIAGAGPAGTVAATVLARAGARVLVVDRATFPRDKLCGDTLNPGALALLRRLGLDAPVVEAGVPLSGMIVTGGVHAQVTGTYRDGLRGRAISRRLLDQVLLDAAAAAGAMVETGTRVVEAMLDTAGAAPVVRGVLLEARGRRTRLPAQVTIAADGRRSTLAFSLGLARHPARPRRWAIGAYYEGVTGLAARGEMHVRPGCYLGVAPLPGGLANTCLVTTPRQGFADPARLLDHAVREDPCLADRFASARRVSRCMTVGPLAVDARAAGRPGLLLAGDAAGFVDPMTGDGLRFAIEGGLLAAEAALEALEHPDREAWRILAQRRRDAFGRKLLFNRALRRLVSSPGAVRLLAHAGRALAPALERVISFAGDVPLALARS